MLPRSIQTPVASEVGENGLFSRDDVQVESLAYSQGGRCQGIVLELTSLQPKSIHAASGTVSSVVRPRESFKVSLVLPGRSL